MVEAIGARLMTGAAQTRRAVIDTPAPATATATLSATPGASIGAAGPAGVATLAAEMAATPPVDSDRVAQIKQAIKDGRYPIMPARIADSLIASRLEWNLTNDPA
ncbi:flagellar biosynthesis anti-sigma factor FlgM [Sphingomonas sp. PB2P19]|uniref:flagellar biosynthesis anti-sigma factor FlgM n=1 Tax=Sphingomonas rhamnosi TaxID=3096156 RepID=UPI002FC6C087